MGFSWSLLFAQLAPQVTADLCDVVEEVLVELRRFLLCDAVDSVGVRVGGTMAVAVAVGVAVSAMAVAVIVPAVSTTGVVVAFAVKVVVGAAITVPTVASSAGQHNTALTAAQPAHTTTG